MILMVCTEWYFDVCVFSTFPCFWYHSIQKEMLFPMTANLRTIVILLAEEQKLMK